MEDGFENKWRHKWIKKDEICFVVLDCCCINAINISELWDKADTYEIPPWSLIISIKLAIVLKVSFRIAMTWSYCIFRSYYLLVIHYRTLWHKYNSSSIAKYIQTFFTFFFLRFLFIQADYHLNYPETKNYFFFLLQSYLFLKIRIIKQIHPL